MKNILLAIFSIALFTVACKKSTYTLETKNSESTKKKRTSIRDSVFFNNHYYHIADGMLQFETIDEYYNLYGTEIEDTDPILLQEFADNVKKSNAINTYWEYKNFPIDSIQYSFIGNIVNQDGIIKIDDYLLLLDFENEKVFMTSNNNTQELLDAVNGDVSDNIEVFSMNDDIASKIMYKKKKGFFCKEYYADREHDGRSIQTLSQVWLEEVQAYVLMAISHEARYASYGIYFELFSRAVVVPAVPYANDYFKLYTTYTWERRCSSKTGGYTYTDDYTNVPTTHYKRVCYGNLRALKHYYLRTILTSPSSPTGYSELIIQD